MIGGAGISSRQAVGGSGGGADRGPALLAGVDGAGECGLFDFLGPVGVVVCAVDVDGGGVDAADAGGVGEVAGGGEGGHCLMDGGGGPPRRCP